MNASINPFARVAKPAEEVRNLEEPQNFAGFKNLDEDVREDGEDSQLSTPFAVNKTELSRMRRSFRDPLFRKASAATLFAASVALGVMMPSSFLVQTSGPTLDVNSTIDNQSLVQVSGVPSYPTSTKLLMTTVSAWGNADGGVNGAQAVTALFSSGQELLPVRAVYQENVTAKEVNAENQQLMTFSQDSASLLAFEMAGYDVSMDIKISQIFPDRPSGRVLQVGDIFRAIKLPGMDEFTEVKSHYQMSQLIDKTDPGTEITVRVERSGELVEESFQTVPYPADATGWVHPGSLLGVAITVENVKLPAEVKYLVEGIGGPSAGSMFTLGIYDQLTPGDLAGEKTIAGTGTVAWDGDIGPIGGIRHKLSGARSAGATDFLAPALNCGETTGYEPAGLKIWAVRNTFEALDAVKAIATGDTSELQSCADVVAKTPKDSE
ncbi:MAG: S16 family serine protease [Arcanobacterium sp.]|nr:S16 family serine protease [Arcanobacterium sp.]